MNSPESRAALPPEGVVFFVGAPRSGTSWIQEEIAGHLGFARMPETHYVADVVRPVLRQWRNREALVERGLRDVTAGRAPASRLIGLPAVADEQVVINALRQPFLSLLDKARSCDPAVRGLVEKSPSNSLFVPEILTVWPAAGVVHVVRDPRAVVRSLRAASRSWGFGWAPRSALLGGLVWRAHVTGAGAAVNLTTRYAVIRYEDARTGLGSEVERIREELGLGPVQHEPQVGHLLLSDAVKRVTGGVLAEPEGFGDGTGQRPSLGRLSTWLVEVMCADVMEGYGYTMRYPSARPANAVVRHLLDRAERRRGEDAWKDAVLGARRYDYFERAIWFVGRKRLRRRRDAPLRADGRCRTLAE